MSSAAADLAQRLRAGIERVVVGNEATTTALLVALLADGHVLLEGVPGTAKTLLVRLLAALIGVEFRRIQFTPDVMPADVVGTTVFDPRTVTFSVRRGPIFTNLVLADEINRTPPKTQSALLEAMEERQVTIDGESHPLDAFFMVCATQNPIEFEGTYPLPEAQLDRFLIRTTTTYPDAAQERELLTRVAHGFDARDLHGTAGVTAIATRDDVIRRQRREVRRVFVADAMRDYLHELVGRTRASHDLALGDSPRAGIALLLAAQASAAIEDRDFVSPDDVKSVAPLVLPHRLIVRPEAEVEGLTAATVVERILSDVEIPRTPMTRT